MKKRRVALAVANPMIRVVLDSMANHESAHEAIVSVEDLGFASRAAWDAASDDERHEAVRNYWLEEGMPEIYWEEIGGD